MLNQLALENMKNHQFKPFDKVLVRHNDEDTWIPTLYGYTLMKNNEIKHICSNILSFTQCIPYNENTAHLAGTKQPYEPPIPKEWKVTNVRFSFDEEYTTDEFIEFIKNNELSVFMVKRIKPNNQPD